MRMQSNMSKEEIGDQKMSPEEKADMSLAVAVSKSSKQQLEDKRY